MYLLIEQIVMNGTRMFSSPSRRKNASHRTSALQWYVKKTKNWHHSVLPAVGLLDPGGSQLTRLSSQIWLLVLNESRKEEYQ